MYARSVRRTTQSYRPIVLFLLIASFGILFAGCSPQRPNDNDFVFTAEDAARFRELARQAEGVEASSESGATVEDGSGSQVPAMNLDLGTGAVTELDLSMAQTYKAVRTGPVASGDNVFRVTNAYVNIRSEPSITAALVEKLNSGDTMTLIDFVDAAWAKIKTNSGKEGFVSSKYIAKMTSLDALAAEKKKYENVYFVNYAFVNVRSAPDSNSEKLGQLPGQSFVRPASITDGFAKIKFEGKDAYVSTQYLAPFQPNYIARQNTYTMPILVYHWGQTGIGDALATHVNELKAKGVNIWSLREFYDLLLKQESQDARLPDSTVVLAIDSVDGKNIKEVGDALVKLGVHATVFIQTKNLGLSGITQKSMSSLVAAGMDIESQGHTGDDLRALTNSQLELEVRQSRKLLEEATGKPVFAIGYPQGGVNDRVSQAADGAGYLLGVGGVPDRSFTRNQLLSLPSYAISPAMSADDIVRIAKG